MYTLLTSRAVSNEWPYLTLFNMKNYKTFDIKSLQQKFKILSITDTTKVLNEKECQNVFETQFE